jgi:hypothetical protein
MSKAISCTPTHAHLFLGKVGTPCAKRQGGRWTREDGTGPASPRPQGASRAKSWVGSAFVSHDPQVRPPSAVAGRSRPRCPARPPPRHAESHKCPRAPRRAKSRAPPLRGRPASVSQRPEIAAEARWRGPRHPELSATAGAGRTEGAPAVGAGLPESPTSPRPGSRQGWAPADGARRGARRRSMSLGKSPLYKRGRRGRSSELESGRQSKVVLGVC